MSSVCATPTPVAGDSSNGSGCWPVARPYAWPNSKNLSLFTACLAALRVFAPRRLGKSGSDNRRLINLLLVRCFSKRVRPTRIPQHLLRCNRNLAQRPPCPRRRPRSGQPGDSPRSPSAAAGCPVAPSLRNVRARPLPPTRSAPHIRPRHAPAQLSRKPLDPGNTAENARSDHRHPSFLRSRAMRTPLLTELASPPGLLEQSSTGRVGARRSRRRFNRAWRRGSPARAPTRVVARPITSPPPKIAAPRSAIIPPRIRGRALTGRARPARPLPPRKSAAEASRARSTHHASAAEPS
jgi:hypothetical protein